MWLFIWSKTKQIIVRILYYTTKRLCLTHEVCVWCVQDQKKKRKGYDWYQRWRITAFKINISAPIRVCQSFFRGFSTSQCFKLHKHRLMKHCRNSSWPGAIAVKFHSPSCKWIKNIHISVKPSCRLFIEIIHSFIWLFLLQFVSEFSQAHRNHSVQQMSV